MPTISCPTCSVILPVGPLSAKCRNCGYDSAMVSFDEMAKLLREGAQAESKTMTADRKKTTVVNIKLHPCDVYIGRGTKWGNRFTHVAITEEMRRKTPNIERVITRAQAIQFYADELKTRHDLLAALTELVGKVLGCSCKPLSCHGDVLAALANGIATCGCEGCEDGIELKCDPVTSIYYHVNKDPIGGRSILEVCARIHQGPHE